MDISDIDIDSLDVDWHMNYLADLTRIYCCDVKSLTAETMTFRGYFNYESDTMPIERIVIVSHRKNVNVARVYDMYFIRITKMKKEDMPFHCSACDSGKDCDPEENHIRFFPDQTITIHYEVIQKLTNDQLFDAIQKMKDDEPAIIEKDRDNERVRKDREMREYNEFCKKYKEEHGKYMWEK